jgi:hypothetical protein
MIRILVAITCLSLLVVGSAQGSVQTYFGEDLGLGEENPLLAWPNAAAARNSFLSGLTGVGTESFEGFSEGSTPPLSLIFPTPSGNITATLTGDMSVAYVDPGTTNGVGRYPTDGVMYLEGSTYDFMINFDQPIAAFGFYGIDIGDFGGQVTLTTVNGGSTVYNIPHTINGIGGSVLFFGVIDTTHLYTQVDIGNTGSGIDYFGFDQMTVGSLGQVIVPVPGAILLGSIGVSLVGWLRRRRTF